MSSAKLSADRVVTLSTPSSSIPPTPDQVYSGHDAFFSIGSTKRIFPVSQGEIVHDIPRETASSQKPRIVLSLEADNAFNALPVGSLQSTPHAIAMQPMQFLAATDQQKAQSTAHMRDFLFGNTPATLERMSILAERSSDRTSIRPALNFLGASAGKLVLGVGAGHLVQGILSNDRTHRDLGIALITVGFSAAVAAAWSFAGDVKKVHNAYGWLLKIGSISAASTIGAGYGLHAYGKVKKDLRASRLSYILLALGPMLLSYTLPRFVSYSEIVHGKMLLPKCLPREAYREICGAVAYGLLFGLAITADGRWPPGFSQACVSLTAIFFIYSIALAKSDHLHAKLHRFLAHAAGPAHTVMIADTSLQPE